MAEDEKIRTHTPPPDTLRKAGYHHGDLRTVLIEATRQLVEEKGPDGFSVTDACRLAGVSTAAPYKHFKDKSEMVLAMVLEGMGRHRENMLRALEGIAPGSPKRVVALGYEYVHFALREPGLFRLKFGGFTEQLDDARLTEVGEQMYGTLKKEVAECLGVDGITADVERRAFMLWSFVHGLSFIMLDRKMTEMGGSQDLDILLNEMSHRILRD